MGSGTYLDLNAVEQPANDWRLPSNHEASRHRSTVDPPPRPAHPRMSWLKKYKKLRRSPHIAAGPPSPGTELDPDVSSKGTLRTIEVQQSIGTTLLLPAAKRDRKGVARGSTNTAIDIALAASETFGSLKAVLKVISTINETHEVRP